MNPYIFKNTSHKTLSSWSLIFAVPGSYCGRLYKSLAFQCYLEIVDVLPRTMLTSAHIYFQAFPILKNSRPLSLYNI
ncbi:hypothetical protein BpHYR1_014386 [Brachionus plicatilis]|uniref:Uncharacterized protein n=1 Tax=Brachionus plicatilis TaxID=10195 RepID=A0A3M7RL59_BRAPC|nr:hypothetical protein BpHYR1_014386 [Brachionus plicatilis]